MFTRPQTQFYRVTSAKRRFELDVGDAMPAHMGQRHRLYGEVSGNPDGPVVLCLHGGPGAGSNPATRQFFDPDHYCVVQFDQRGAGRSTPWACVEQNDTPSLVDDIERVADHLDLKRFTLFGGSWGSTLALAYVNKYPHRVQAMVLRGIFLGRRRDIDWFLQGLEGVHPEAYGEFLAPLSPEDRAGPDSIIQAYVRQLNHPSRDIAERAAAAWARYEDAAATLTDNTARQAILRRFQDRRANPQGHTNVQPGRNAHLLAIARLEAHYLANALFLPPSGLLADARRWNHLPGAIVHGRYDMVCQVQGAIELAKAWPGATLNIVDNAGHSTFEEGIAKHLLDCMERLKPLLIP